MNTTTTEPTVRPSARPASPSISEGCTFKKVVACFTRPSWSIATDSAGCKATHAQSLDAAILDGSIDAIDIDAVALALKPLGRMIVAAPWKHAEALETSIRDASAAPGNRLAVTSRLVLDDGRRVVVAERCGDAGLATRRRDAHAGAYKMSRYKAYHQMQAAVARLVPATVKDVIEIGDSNGVIRDMLGSGEALDYFRAHYPPHDLQTLHLIPDASRDAFICDNTLEHVADPHAAVRQMARVLRPGGWLVLFAPFIAMCQDDDRCRWSVRALGELLAPHFDSGMLGGWGNIEAACWYMRANKWLRVVAQRGDTLLCRDSREAGSPIVEVPAANDRLHPIHVWGVVRKADSGLPVPPGARIESFLGLNLDHKAPTKALSEMLPLGANVLIGPGDDGSIADRLIELGLKPTVMASNPALTTAALSRGYTCVQPDEIQPGLAAVILNAASRGVEGAPVQQSLAALAPNGLVMVLGEPGDVERLTAVVESCGFNRPPAARTGSAILTRSR